MEPSSDDHSRVATRAVRELLAVPEASRRGQLLALHQRLSVRERHMLFENSFPARAKGFSELRSGAARGARRSLVMACCALTFGGEQADLSAGVDDLREHVAKRRRRQGGGGAKGGGGGSAGGGGSGNAHAAAPAAAPVNLAALLSLTTWPQEQETQTAAWAAAQQTLMSTQTDPPPSFTSIGTNPVLPDLGGFASTAETQTDWPL